MSWNSSEWFPSLMLSAKALGKLPDTLGAMDRIDWLPVDLLGDMLVETVMREQSVAGPSPAGAEFLHYVYSLHIRWSDIVSKLASQTTPSPQITPYKNWLQELAIASEHRTDEVANMPAIKLLDFFQDIGRSEAKRPTFSTAITEEACPSLRTCGAVSTTWLLLWMKQWGLDIQDEDSCAKDGRSDSPLLHSVAVLVPTVWQTC